MFHYIIVGFTRGGLENEYYQSSKTRAEKASKQLAVSLIGSDRIAPNCETKKPPTYSTACCWSKHLAT
jgi:hypothetical protein